MKLTNEIFSNIKTIKMNGWEQFFANRLNKVRDKEIEYLRKSNMSEIFMYATMWLTPMAITISTFFMFMMFGGILTPVKAFSIIATFYLLQNPMRELPLFIINYVEFNSSTKRIQDFLLSEEIHTDHILRFTLLPSSKYAIEIKNGNFY